MKKNYLLIGLFLLLGGATAWYFFGKNSGSTSTLGWDRLFRVENEADIHKIFIAKRTGETTTLERSGDHWTYNGKGRVSKNAMENVLEAVTKVELQSVPAQAAIPNIVKEMAARSIKVEVFDKAGKKLKSYYVGGVTPDARGTYMIMENSELPHVVEIPMMEGQIRTRFDLTGDAWRDRSVFSYQPEDIEAVSIEYPGQRNKSFKLTRKGSGFEVKPFYESTPAITQPVEKANVEAFLYEFKGKLAESFDNQNEAQDSIKQTVPFTVISVTDKKGEERSVALFPFYRLNSDGVRKAEIIERYFAAVNNGDFMLVQHGVLSKLFWPYQAFFEKGGGAEKN